MRRSGVAAVVIGGTSVLLAVFLLVNRDAPLAGTGVSSEGLAEALHAPALPEPESVTVPESEPIDAIEAKRFHETDDIASVSPEETLGVLVVDEQTGIPVPGAEVAWVDERSASSMGGVFAATSTLISDFDHATHRTVANARGVAVVRACEQLGVAARSGDRFGYRRFKEIPRGEVRLVIAPGILIAAKVVTASGAPVGGVNVMFSLGSQSGRGSSSRHAQVRSREPDGLAIAHHTGVKFEHPLGKKGITHVSVSAAGTEDRVKATIEDLRGGPITLVVRPTGRVIVNVRHADGTPFLDETKVSLRETRSPFASPEVSTRNGTAEFPMVVVGSPLTVTAETEGFDQVTREGVEGPQVPGEATTIELRFVRQRAVVQGQAFDEFGSPISFRDLRAELVYSERSLVLPTPLHLKTDERGVFEFTVDRGVRNLTELDLLLETRDAHDAIERHARNRLPDISLEKETWIGSIQLSLPKVLASGVVYDDLGAPVSGASVSVDGLTKRFPPGFVLSYGGRSLPDVSQSYRTSTDEAGAFAIPMPGLYPGAISSFIVKAELQGFICESPSGTVTPGHKGIKVVLRAAGIIEGRLLLPDSAPVRRLKLSASYSEPAGAAAVSFEDCVESTGAFRLTGLRAGVVKIEVRLDGVSEPLASIPDVVVRRLETTEDPRLQSIDLRTHPALRTN